jgi:hypothetical protein
MIETASPEKRAYRLKLQKATGPGNRTLNRRTQSNERGVITRLGYGTICQCYSKSSEIGLFSGSTLNRKYAIQKRIEKREAFEAMEKRSEMFGGTDVEYRKFTSSLRDIFAIKNSKPKHKRKFPLLETKCSKPLHFLSTRSKGKVRDKCTAFHRCLGTRKTFATLTFLNDVSDKDAVKILNKFFTELREDFPDLKYIWIAERQTKTTNRIHFHIIINKFLPVRHYNAIWTLQQYNSGVIDPDISLNELLSMIEWDKENPDKKSEVQKHFNPFDVKKINGIHGLSYYLTKYVTKNQSGSFECLAWHCSRSVSRLFTKVVVSRSTFAAAGSFVNSRLDRKTGELTQIKAPPSPFYQLYYIENKPYFLPEMAELELVNREIINGINPAGIFTEEEEEFIKHYLN